MSTETKKQAVARLRLAAGYRVPVKPDPVPACRNCGHYACDHSDREGAKGVYFEIVNSRCLKHVFPVSRNTVCDTHQLRYKDWRDV